MEGRADERVHEKGRLTLPLETSRLRLRHWTPADRVPFAALNADPEVCAFLPSVLTRPQSDQFADRIEAGFAQQGFGLWAVEIKDGPPFIGFVGLAVPRVELPSSPCVEIGWRLAREYWGQGYATEAAQQVLVQGFGPLGLDEIVSFTATSNVPSQRVMQRIGMERDPAEDFDHPTLPGGHPLQRHVLYRLKNRP